MKRTPFPFPPRLEGPVAITNVSVIPMDVCGILPHQTVIVEDGFIQAIEHAGNVSTTGMTVVEGAGMYLLPGLADMHVHSWSPGDLTLFLANGVTFVRNMSGAPFHLALQQRIRRGELPGPRIVTTSPIIEGPSASFPMWYGLDDPQGASSLVEQCVARGYEQIKVYNDLSPATLRALGAAARKNAVRMTGHCPTAVTFEEAIESGMTCFEHFVGIWRGHLTPGAELPMLPNLALEVLQSVARDMDFNAIRRLAHRMAVDQIWNCPTLVATKLMYEGQSEGSGDPLIKPWLKYVPQVAMRVWRDLDPSPRFLKQPHSFREWRKAIHHRNEAFARLITILHEEGAPLLAGTDTPVRFVVPGFSLHLELENLVAAGLRAYDALRCATSEAARFVGQSDLWGTVRVGRRADLLLVGTNPLDDIRALRHPEAVFVNGYYLTRQSIDQLLTHQAEQAALTPPGSLPELAFDAAGYDGILVKSGTLIEQTKGNVSGMLSYRHWQLADSDWFIDECYSFEQGLIFRPGGGCRRLLKSRLSPTFGLRRCTIVEESFAGVAHLELSWNDGQQTYVSQTVDEDGRETTTTLGNQMLLPDVTLGMTIPLLIFTHGESTIRSRAQLGCRLEDRCAVVVEVRVCPDSEAAETQPTSKLTWRVSAEESRQSNDYTYRVAADGDLVGVTHGTRLFLPVANQTAG